MTQRPGRPLAPVPAFVAFAAALVPFLASPARGGEPLPPLQAQDLFDLELVADPQISRDGKLVVYERQFGDLMTDKYYSNIWAVGVDGKDHRPLTTGRRSDKSPRLSPDGTRLAFVSEVDGQSQIVVRHLKTGDLQIVTRVLTPPSGISWSPDGKQIAYVALAKEEAPKVATLPTAPEGATWADPPKIIDRLVYRFDGLGYLPNGFSQVFVVSAEGGLPRALTSGRLHHGRPGVGYGGATAWTPEGDLVIVANRRADWELNPDDSEIYSLSTKDGALKALTDRRGPDFSPAVSPDGRQIAYFGYDDRYVGYQVRRLYVMNRDGSGARSLTESFDRDPDALVWAPDGSGIHFVYDDEGETKLAVVSLEGKVKTLASPLGSDDSAYGGRATLSVAADGTLAFPLASPSRPGDIAVLPRPAKAPRVLTEVNDDLMSQRRLGDVEGFWYESSHDKRRLQGWIVKPPGFDATKKYPLILEIHGGPFANYGPRFAFAPQVWAGLGYVVVYVNPRGSTSYGESSAT